MKNKLLSWLYCRFKDKPAASFTAEIVANGLKQPVENVAKAFEELEFIGAIKKASRLKLNTYRLTDIGLVTAKNIFECE
ncbi:MAG: hypothetical protein JWN76_1809 [Chitinophagaceae bacterium]|nr:hypothetical protein [Chitinophagaceae bacterium]